uniref:Uncharacterized protein n=1 Tax=Opuntia streptacantha TaxID=393608 RepID=A0A7C9AXX9_OPUST
MSKRVALVVESLWEILICVKLCFHFALCCIWAAFHLIIVYWDVFHIGFEREIEFSLLWKPINVGLPLVSLLISVLAYVTRARVWMSNMYTCPTVRLSCFLECADFHCNLKCPVSYPCSSVESSTWYGRAHGTVGVT